MPELSRFGGMVIHMYPDDHPWPHFHVRYAGRSAIVRLNDMTIRGSLPRNKARTLLDWAELHEAELWDNWNAAESRGEMFKIAGQ